MAGDQAHRVGGHNLLPALEREHRRGERSQDGGADGPCQEGQQRRHGEEGRGHTRRQGDPELRPVARHREGEGPHGQRGDLGRVRLNRERERHEERQSERLAVPAPRPQPGERRPEQQDQQHQTAIQRAVVLGTRRRHVGAEQAQHDRHDGAGHDPERQQVEVGRAHPVGQGEVSEQGEPDRGCEVHEPLQRRAEERRPGQRQRGPQHHQHACEEGGGGQQPGGRRADRPLTPVDHAGDDQEDHGDRREDHGGAARHLGQHGERHEQAEEADAAQERGGIERRIDRWGFRRARHRGPFPGPVRPDPCSIRKARATRCRRCATLRAHVEPAACGSVGAASRDQVTVAGVRGRRRTARRPTSVATRQPPQVAKKPISPAARPSALVGTAGLNSR